MDAYQKFKNEIDGILDDLDCLLYVLDEQTEENHTVSYKIEIYEDTADRLKKAFEDLKLSEGNTLVKNINYKGSFRN